MQMGILLHMLEFRVAAVIDTISNIARLRALIDSGDPLLSFRV